MRALEKRPEDRYQSAEEMRHDLEEFLEESGLKSGNRRMALYMQEVFAPDAATSDVGVEKARAFGDARAAGSSPGGDAADDNLGRAGSRPARAACDAHRGCPRAAGARARSTGRPAAQGQMTPSARTARAGRPQRLRSAPLLAQARASVGDRRRHARRRPAAGWLFIAVFVAIGDRGDGNHDFEMIRSAARCGRPVRA